MGCPIRYDKTPPVFPGDKRTSSRVLLASLAGAAIPLLLLLAYMSSGCATALPWRTTAGVMHASNTTGKQLAQLARSEVTAKRSGLSTDEVKVCKEWRGHLERWQTYGRPAIRSGVALAASTLLIAESAGKHKADWLSPLKGAGCGLWQALRSWGHMLPDKGAAALGALSWLDSGLCPAPSRAVGGTIAAVLSIGLEIFRWIAGVIGSPTDKLKAEIAAWLKAPPADETEPVLQSLRERCP